MAGVLVCGAIALALTLGLSAHSANAPGFSAAEGWNTTSTGIDPAPPQAPVFVASNVPIDPQDDVGSIDGTTVNGLSGDGVVTVVTLFPRNPDGSGYPPRSLPLQLSDATLEDGFEGVSTSIADESQQASVGNSDLDVMAFFGTTPPTQAQLATAQTELDRLVIPTS